MWGSKRWHHWLDGASITIIVAMLIVMIASDGVTEAALLSVSSIAMLVVLAAQWVCRRRQKSYDDYIQRKRKDVHR
jgi:uncharacterized membrane protein (DUF485 family)